MLGMHEAGAVPMRLLRNEATLESRLAGNFRFQHMSQNCSLTVHELYSLYEHSSSMVCQSKQSTPSSRLLLWRRSTTPHQPGGDLHVLMTVVAWRHFTVAVNGSVIATTIPPLPACVMKLTNDFSREKSIIPLIYSSPSSPLSNSITITCVNVVTITNFQIEPMQ